VSTDSLSNSFQFLTISTFRKFLFLSYLNPLCCSLSPFSFDLPQKRWDPPPTNTHPCSTPNWPAPNILLLKSTHFPASFLGASNLAKAGLGQPPVSTTTWTLNGHHAAVIDSLPSRSKKSPPRRHVLTSTFRATGSKFLENFQHILSLISPLGL